MTNETNSPADSSEDEIFRANAQAAYMRDYPAERGAPTPTAPSADSDGGAAQIEPLKPADYPPPDAALAEFTDYFVRNYPGPDTIITDPKWHAPKLFRAAQRAISRAGLRSGVSADPLPDHNLQNVWRGIYKTLDKHVPGWCINRAPGVTIAQALVLAVEKLASQQHQVKKGEPS